MTEPQETILVVDDDPYIQEALKDRLVSLGYQVTQASDGKQALEMIGRQTPQMAFLDIEMPGMKGMEVLKELRRQEKDFPVIMITAYGTIDIAVEAMKEGAADFVAKPFKGSHIAMVVQRTMEQQRLRRGIEVLTQEVDKRYQMVPGKSERMAQATASRQESRGDPQHRVTSRRERRRQGAVCPRHPQLERPQTASLRRHQLCRFGAGSFGKRALRPRARRLHRRASAQKGQNRNGRRRHGVS